MGLLAVRAACSSTTGYHSNSWACCCNQL